VSTLLTGPEMLKAYAARVEVVPVEQWGRLAVAHTGPFDLDGLRGTVEGRGLTAIGRFGADFAVEVQISSDVPSDAELQALQSVVATENERLALLNPADGWTAARHAQSAVGGHEILPSGGHVAARWRPTVLPSGGQQNCPR